LETENQILKFDTNEADIGKRLDVFLADHVEDWSRSRLKKLIDEGDVLLNQKPVKSSYRIRENDTIEIELKPAESDNFEPENIPLDIVFEDEFLAVLNKPAGMIVHPGAGVSSGTLANALAFKFQSEGDDLPFRVGIVHRLDKDTSGLMVVAKNELTLEKLSAQFRDRKVQKSYVALAHGFVRKLVGKIDQPIARDRKNRVKMAINKNGRNAVSIYKVRQRYERYTLLNVQIKTGRTHQIRVHLAHLKHPIVGDATYNEGRDKTIADAQMRKAISNISRVFLHAEKLSFVHPVSKEKLEFHSPMPNELTELLNMI
jgi:23S rRNA pseudouridine1911/1915/1917 synthase